MQVCTEVCLWLHGKRKIQIIIQLGSDILVLQGLHFLPKYGTHSHSIPLMNEFFDDLGPHGFKYTLYDK